MLFVGTSIIHPSTEGVFLLCNILDLLIYSVKFKDPEKNVGKYITNCLVEYVMKCFGLEEVNSDSDLGTTNWGTRIDRVFTNISRKKVNVRVQTSFLENECSDHAGLIIQLNEEK